MGGSKPKAPEQSSDSKENEKLQNELLKQQLEDAKNPEPLIKIPKVKPALPNAPAPQQSSADAFAAGQEAKRAAYRRTNAGRGTLFAGETGGYRAGAVGGPKTLLG